MKTIWKFFLEVTDVQIVFMPAGARVLPVVETAGMGRPLQIWAEVDTDLVEALRAVDRYGVADSGEQYRGYRQIAATATVSTQDPRGQLARIAGIELTDETDKVLIAHARRAVHPDRGGSAELWHEVEELARALGEDR